jgi:hypothetical protein
MPVFVVPAATLAGTSEVSVALVGTAAVIVNATVAVLGYCKSWTWIFAAPGVVSRDLSMNAVIVVELT